MGARRLAPVALVLMSACDWVTLAHGALTYETLRAGEAANVVVIGARAYAALGDSGIAIVDALNGRRIGIEPPPPGSESVDDLAVADGLLFALDARAPGHLSVLGPDGSGLAVLTAPQPVEVGPFSGVSARAGSCVVSGGTSRLTLWSYTAAGRLHGPEASLDLGRGQPDAVLGQPGMLLVSTHYWGPRFGLDVVRFDSARTLRRVASLPLPGAGFTAGGAKPASFPVTAAVLNDSTVLVAYARGVAVVSVRDPARPALARVLDVGGHAVAIAAHEPLALVTVAAPSAAVVRVDFTGGEPRLTRLALPAGTNPLGVAFSGDQGVVAAREKGVLVLR